MMPHGRLLFFLCGMLLLGLGFTYGFLSHRYHLFPYEEIRLAFRRASHALSSAGPGDPPPWAVADLDSASRSKLQALGYLQGYEEASRPGGTELHDPERAFPGHSFYVSAHAPEAILTTLDGRRLHSWRLPFREACPGKDDPQSTNQRYFRRARLLPGGGVLAIYDYEALVRLDRHSQLVWARCEPYHHDLDIAPDGRIYVLRQKRRIVSEVHDWDPILDDVVEILGPEGEDLAAVSISDAFLASEYAPLLKTVDRRLLPENNGEGDVLHTNAVKILDEQDAARLPMVRAGHVLISVRNLDTVAILDLEAERVVWALTGLWRRQHDPVWLDNGNLLVFDNLHEHQRSRVLEIDPTSQRVVWQYEGRLGEPFFSGCCGSNQRLANGNTLITVSEGGRALETTPDGDVVWEFWSPHRVGEKEELVATLMDVIRLEPEFELGWLDEAGTREFGRNPE